MACPSQPSNPADSRTGGCWTCRIRRKKCDEEHGEDDSCSTCRRLKIVCLGWGTPKPEWMKDKEAVENYKAQIKAQLIRAGRIRGQPKSLSPTSQSTRPSHPYLQRSNSARSISTSAPSASSSASRPASAPQPHLSVPIVPPALPMNMPPRIGLYENTRLAPGRPEFDVGFYPSTGSSSASTSTSSGGRISQSPSSNLLIIGPQTPSQQPPYSSYDYVHNSSTAFSPDQYVRELASLFPPNSLGDFSAQALVGVESKPPRSQPNTLSSATGNTRSPFTPYQQLQQPHLSQHRSDQHQNAYTTTVGATARTIPGPSSAAAAQAAFTIPLVNGIPTGPPYHVDHPQQPTPTSHLGLKLNTIDLSSENELTPQASAASSNPSAIMAFSTAQESLISYYFEKNVFCAHIPLATASERQEIGTALRDVIHKQPGGPVALIACALAGLHASRTAGGGREYGLEPSLVHAADQYYSTCYWQIQKRLDEVATSLSTVSPPALTGNAGLLGGPTVAPENMVGASLNEMEVLAAMQMFQFILFAGETPKNLLLLHIAYQWLENSSIGRSSDPARALASAAPLMRFVVRTVIWTDIFSSICQRLPPTLQDFYCRLREAGKSNNEMKGTDALGLGMETFTGCPDEILMAYAEIATLEAQGDQRRAAGSLSIMGFVDRARGIESRLLNHGSGKASIRGTFDFASAVGQAFAQSSPASSGSGPSSSPKFSSPLSPPATATSAASPASSHFDSFSVGVGRGASRSPAASNYAQSLHPEARESDGLVAEIHRLGALIYLYTVLNGNYPNVPEIREVVQNLISNLKRLPITPSERGLIFPIFLAACLVEDSLERSFFRNRLSVQDPAYGNIAPALRALETIWARRDFQGPGVDWRITLNEAGSYLLLL